MSRIKAVFTTLNKVTIALVWALVIVLGILAAIAVITVLSIVWSISVTAGLGFLAFIILVMWMIVYSLNS